MLCLTDTMTNTIFNVMVCVILERTYYPNNYSKMSVGNEKHRVLHESQEHNLGKKTKAEGKGKRSKKAFQKSPYNI